MTDDTARNQRPPRGGASRTIDLDGPVHYVDFGGTGTPLVLVHGLGGSHLNWMLVAPQLAEHHHVVAIDLIGFGLTPPADRSSRMRDQVTMLDRFIDAVMGEPVVLVGNSMGGMVAALTAAGHPSRVSSLVLVDPAMGPRDTESFSDLGNLRYLAAPLLPGIGPKLLTRSRQATTPADYIRESTEYVAAHPENIPPAYIDAGVALETERREMPWAVPSFVQAARSIAQTIGSAASYRRALHSIGAPTLLIQGEVDRLVTVSSGRWLAGQRPDWRYVELPDVGHIAMIEVPERFIELVTSFLAESLPDPPATGSATG